MRIFFIFAYQNKQKQNMNNTYQDFLSQPLWFTIPMVLIYLGLIAFIIYFVWKNKKQ